MVNDNIFFYKGLRLVSITKIILFVIIRNAASGDHFIEFYQFKTELTPAFIEFYNFSCFILLQKYVN